MGNGNAFSECIPVSLHWLVYMEILYATLVFYLLY